MNIDSEQILKACRNAMVQADISNEDFSTCCMRFSSLVTRLWLYKHGNNTPEHIERILADIGTITHLCGCMNTARKHQDILVATLP